MPTPHRSRRVISVLFSVLCGLVALPRDLSAADAPPPPKKQGRMPGARSSGGNDWWREIDTGPFISDTFVTASGGDVVALKGLAIKLGSARDVSVVFDTELLCWRGGFDGAVVLEGTPWDGRHGGNSHYPAGDALFYFQNPTGLGFAIDGTWSDPRDPKAGPLPRNLGRYRGLFRHGREVVVHYTLGSVNVLELPALETVNGVRAITRTVNIDGTPAAALELLVRDKTDARSKPDAQVYLVGAPQDVALKITADGRVTVSIPKGTSAARFKIVYAEHPADPASFAAPRDLEPLTHGGPALFPQTFAVKGELDPAAATKTYAVDAIPLPLENPWKSPPRFGGFDFFSDGKRIAASTWNGDVWIADGIDGDLSHVTWRRFASGLFQTLGLKIVDDVIYTQGRDQITRLRDLDGDGEADSYECFNNDVMITAGFHEFTFDLQTDAEGNFYFSKAMPVNQGGRGFMESTPHNGTVMKVSKDGSKLEVVAWGFRAPGGVGVRSDGVVTTGENEGTFVPACKITWTPPGKVTFNGVVPSKWDHSNYVGPLPGAPTDYEKPLCWIPYYADNSSGSQVWVPQNTSWDPRHAGELLHLSYGKSSVFRVLREEVNGVVQGGVYRLPIDVSAAVMRARFHSHNGQLYAVGFRGWQTNGRDALHRVRYTGVNTALPVELHAHQNGLLIRFSAPLDAATAEDPSRYSISKWNYVWGPQYGSGRFSIDQRDLEAEQKAITEPSKGAHNIIDTVTVAAAKVVDDGRGVFLYIPKMTPAMQMEVKLDLADAKGGVVRETIYNTVHTFAPEFQIPGVRWQDIRVAETKPVGEPGLVMTFNGETTDAVRVDQLALTVPEGMAPSVFIAPRAFGAAWQGTLVVPERDDYTFALEGRGTVSLRIDGKVVVSGELPVAASAPLSLAKGSHAIYCSYQSPANGEARVRLLWSSPQFRSEPVPASAFRFIPSAELESWSKVRTGREVFVAAQCVKCHAPRNGVPRDATPELLTAAPDFKNIGNRLDAGWLEQWVRAPQGHCPTIAANDAASVAGYLATLKDTDAEGGAPPPSGPGFQRDSQIKRAASPATQAGSESQPHLAEPGAALVEKLHLGFWIEPLTKLRKFSDHGLVEFLQHPALHHADTTFPDVRLSRDEALQVAAYVASRQPAPGARGGSPGDMAAGAKIVASSCSACHATADAKPSTAVAASFEDVMRRDWTVKGCVAENRGRAPDLHLSRDDVSALIAFRNSDRDVGLQSLRRFAPAEYATSQMKLLNCAQCHAGAAGDGSKIPDITFAGEKFDRDWLTGLFSGRHPKIRGWLDARMPAFASRAANLSLGLAAKHGVPLQTPAPAARPELVAVGAKLAGSEGYACVACHDAGTKKALQVFEGQGTNLQLAGERLRYDYFQRWMHFPQRIAPTTIMPRFTQGRDRGLLNTPLDGDAEKQFEAVWQWMQTLRNGGL